MLFILPHISEFPDRFHEEELFRVWGSEAVETAKVKNLPTIESFFDREWITRYFLTINFGHFLLVTSRIFFDSWITSLNFTNSLIGILICIMIFFLGKIMYGNLAGSLCGFFSASSILLIHRVKCGATAQNFGMLLIAISVYLFYLSIKKYNYRKLFISLIGITIGISFFSWVACMITLLIIIFFNAIEFFLNKISYSKESITQKLTYWTVKNYILFISVTTISILIFWKLLIAYLKLPECPLIKFAQIFRFLPFINKSFSYKLPLFRYSLSYNFFCFIGLTFLCSIPVFKDIFADINLYLPGRSLISPFIAILFIIGIFLAIRRKLLADKLNLISIFLLFSIFILRFDHEKFNYIIVALPFILTLSSTSLIYILNLLKLKIQKSNSLILKYLCVSCVLIIILSVGYSGYSSYNYIYSDFNWKENLGSTIFKTPEVVNFIDSNSNPKDCFIVIGGEYTFPLGPFLFLTREKKYKTEIFMSLINKFDKGPNELKKREIKTLKKYNEIYYILAKGPYLIGNPGEPYHTEYRWELFESTHPLLMPVKTFYFNSGTPSVEIYKVTRETPRNKIVNWAAADNSQKELFLDRSANLDSIWIKGPAVNPSVEAGKEKIDLNIALKEDCQLFLNLNKTKSKILISSSLYEKEHLNNAYEFKNVTAGMDPGGSGGKCIQLDSAGEGYIIYKIESPYKIRKLIIQSSPRIYNDFLRKNCVSAWYSIDNKEYVKIYELRSTGLPYLNRWKQKFMKWTHPFNKQSYHTISNLVTDKIYIKFLLEGNKGESQIWANEDHPLKITAELETKGLKRIEFSSGLNKILFKNNLNQTSQLKLILSNSDL